MSDREVLNCGGGGRLEVVKSCQRQWQSLDETEAPRTRYCGDCDRLVYKVLNVVEARVRAKQGECIAVPPSVARATRLNIAAYAERLIVGGFNWHWSDEIPEGDPNESDPTAG